jgi:uncharacterized phage protein (TIGR02220 family)
VDELKLIDIADDLIILNRTTIENIYHLENGADCIALYILYYKLAKWQKSNIVKATDEYVKKCLKWGKNKILNTKKTLKENGLIEIIQKKDEDGKINGWYVKISYIISKQNISDVNIEPEVSKPEVSKSTSGFQDTIALKYNINCLNNKIEEENNILLFSKNDEKRITQMDFYREVIDFMNTVYTHPTFKVKQQFFYKPTSKDTQGHINARLRDGYDIEDFKDVIYFGYLKFVEKEFFNDKGESSFKFFRPSTLFSDKHFGEYLNEYKTTCKRN